MLTLEKQKAKLTSLNPRAEKHGDENVPAADLKFTFDAPNTILSEFHPELKSSFYRKADASDAQGELVDGPGHLPKLRFPRVPGIKWDGDMVGAALTVHYGTGGKSDIELEVDVDGFSFDFKDGGTVTTSFRAKAKPDDKEIAKLYRLIQCEVDISLAPAQSEVAS
jgi:hypothetical protein